MQHQWKQIKHKDKYVIGWKCEHCEVSAGRHFPDWPEDRPPAHWLEVTKIGEECRLPPEQGTRHLA